MLHTNIVRTFVTVSAGHGGLSSCVEYGKVVNMCHMYITVFNMGANDKIFGGSKVLGGGICTVGYSQGEGR